MGRVTGREEWEKLPACGGSEGKPWNYKPDGPILKITVYFDEKEIRGMKFRSETREGVSTGSPEEIGHTEGGRNPQGLEIFDKEVCIDTSIEQLVSLRVACDHQLRSLTFFTRSRQGTDQEPRGPVGTERRFGPPNPTTDVVLGLEGRVIVGFHGRLTGAGYPNAIGVFVTPPIQGTMVPWIVAIVCILIYIINLLWPNNKRWIAAWFGW